MHYYEYSKLEKLGTLKGNLLAMGDHDINGSIMYTEPREHLEGGQLYLEVSFGTTGVDR